MSKIVSIFVLFILFSINLHASPVVISERPFKESQNNALDSVIVVKFSKKMATDADGRTNNALISPESVFTITPDINGNFRWKSNQMTLEFIPSENLKPNTRYEVEIGEEATDVNGETLLYTYKWGFTTLVLKKETAKIDLKPAEPAVVQIADEVDTTEQSNISDEEEAKLAAEESKTGTSGAIPTVTTDTSSSKDGFWGFLGCGLIKGNELNPSIFLIGIFLFIIFKITRKIKHL